MIGKSTTPEEADFLDLSAIANNKVPVEVAPLLNNIEGLVIPKKDMKDRPLGLRDSFANLCVKCSMKVLKPRITQIFDGTNYALAGSNKMSELISLSSSHLKTNPEHDNIFIDLPNAFNECSRLNAANEIMTRCPELAKLFGLFYKNDSKVWLREENENWRAFATEEGCVQGCVMGPLVFGFATIALYEKVQNELKNKENSLFKAYSDDSFIGASHDNAVAAFKVFKEDAEASNNEIAPGVFITSG